MRVRAELRGMNASARIHEQGRTLEAGRVERTEESGDSVRYTDICLLAPGEWTDAASRTTIFYAPDAIKRSARNWVDNQVNLYHQPGDPIANVGHIDTDSVYADDAGALYGDVILHGRTSASEDAIGLMDLALETDGEQGIGGPSVEIPEDKTEWDDTRGMERMTEMAFSGAALVMHPASRKVSFDKQFEERAVAMAEGGEERDVRLMTREETTKPTGSETGGMGDPNDPDDPLKALASAQNRIRELQKELQNPTDDLLAAIDAYLADESASEEDPLDAFLSWAEENGFEEEAGLAQSADVGTVGELNSWAEAATTSEEEADPEEAENPEGEMEEPEGTGVGGEQPGPGSAAEDGAALPDETARAVASALDDVASTIEAVQEAVEEEIDGATVEMEEYRDEMQAELADVKSRISKLEGDSSPRSMADGTGDVTEDEEMLDVAASTPTTDGRYISR